MQRNVIVIGGGASGLMAALTAASQGAAVTILEANDAPGRKLLASGNGKCNLTNADQRPECYRSSSPARVWELIRNYPPELILHYFNELGLVTTDRSGWIYPLTDQSSSVLDVLLAEAERLSVRIRTNTRADEIIPEKNGFQIRAGNWSYHADRVILSCGSPASAVKGSSDAASGFAKALNLPFEPFTPALVPLRIRGDFCKKWAGVRIQSAITLFPPGGQPVRESGTIQLTDYGISGIPVMQVSRFAVSHTKGGTAVPAEIDFFPFSDEADTASMLRRRFERAPHSGFKGILTGMLPQKLIPVIASRAEALCRASEDTDIKAASLAGVIRRFPLIITGSAQMKHAQVCAGGILFSGLTASLECRQIPGLYVTGECADIDGTCGGYNLHWAWASGMTAGRAAAG